MKTGVGFLVVQWWLRALRSMLLDRLLYKVQAVWDMAMRAGITTGNVHVQHDMQCQNWCCV